MSVIKHVRQFTPLGDEINHISLPQKFTYPFCYQPHPLAQVAAQLLQQKLSKQQPRADHAQGRMFGVLVVRNSQQQLGYISAVSGTELSNGPAEQQDHLLVPSVFPGFDTEHDFFLKQALVNQLSEQIKQLENSVQYQYCRQRNESEQAAAIFQITRQQAQMVINRKIRKSQRAQIACLLNEQHQQQQPQEFAQATKLSIELARQSVTDKKQLAQLKSYWHSRQAQAQQALSQSEQTLSQLKKTRQKISHRLQKLLFKHYRLVNSQGEVKDLLDIFAQFAQTTPPAGAGDCAAPKLLQYAFLHQLTPITMAEFWWGPPAASEIRKHLHYYPACQGKCGPILSHMLKGMVVDENPLLNNPAQDKVLEIVYQDQHLVVVNKPAGLLSVPGKHIKDSAYSRVKAMFKDAQGSLVLHRLDMATSGLLLFSLNERAHKHLQKQFIDKEIQKRYVALLAGKLTESSGVITLPLITDMNDRPRQKVCFEHGKYAETRWQLLSTENNISRVELNPVTGRTHQLRVHCAHPQGLNIAMVGDGLYGHQANRLHLHAQQLSFTHPVSKQPMHFHRDAEF